MKKAVLKVIDEIKGIAALLSFLVGGFIVLLVMSAWFWLIVIAVTLIVTLI